MNCNQVVLTPLRKRLCFLSGLGFGAGSLTLLYQNRYAVRDWYSRVYETVSSNSKGPPVDLDELHRKRYEEAQKLGRVGPVIVSITGTMILAGLFPLIIYEDYQGYKREGSCCRLIRKGITRSVFYPCYIGGLLFSSYITKESISTYNRKE